jgi:hypothetical protein
MMRRLRLREPAPILCPAEGKWDCPTDGGVSGALFVTGSGSKMRIWQVVGRAVPCVLRIVSNFWAVGQAPQENSSWGEALAG